MNRRILLVAFLVFLFSTCSFSYKSSGYIILAPIVIIGAWIIINFRLFKINKKHFVRMLCFLLICFAVGCLRGKLYAQRFLELDSILCDFENEIAVEGAVVKKEIKNEEVIYTISDAKVLVDGRFYNNKKILFYSDTDKIKMKSVITIKGKNSPFSTARNRGNFDEKDYYNSLGISGRIKEGKVINIYEPKLGFWECLYRLRRKVVAIYGTTLPGEEAGVLSSMVCGDKSLMIKEAKDLYRLSGLAHLTAISGTHISALGMSLYSILRKRRRSFCFSSIIAGGFIVIYGIFAGAGISTIRAVGMFLIYLLSQVLGEAYDLLSAVSLMGMGLVFKCPFYALNTGFLFSFMAVFSVGLIVNPMLNIYRDYCNTARRKRIIFSLGLGYKDSRLRKVWERFVEGLIVSAGISLGTLPIVARFYYEIPLYSVLLNILVIPLLVVVLDFGIVGAVGGMFAPILGRIPLKVCHLILYFYEFLSAKSLELPFSRIVTGYPSNLKTFSYYALVFSGMSLVTQRVLVVWTLSIIALIFTLFNPCRKNMVSMLDAGQGDGSILTTERGGYVFVDGGSSNIKEVGEYRILPALKYEGIGHIDYWFISHGDEDHISGLLEALESDYQVKNIVMSKYAVDSDLLSEVKKLAKEKGSKVLLMDQGNVLTSDEMKIQCLGPGVANQSEDANEKSLVIKAIFLKDDISILFVGDIGEESEKELVEKYGMYLDADILKVAHHGSKYSNTQEFLERVSPSISTISCSAKNRYGHPHAETLERLEETKTKVLRTDEMGQIILILESKQISVETVN